MVQNPAMSLARIRMNNRSICQHPVQALLDKAICSRCSTSSMSHCMSTRAGIDACDNNINLEETIYICANCCRLVLRFELPVIIHNSLTDKWPLSAASDLRGSRPPLFLSSQTTQRIPQGTDPDYQTIGPCLEICEALLFNRFVFAPTYFV